jgi:predicted lipoprotein DUF2279
MLALFIVRPCVATDGVDSVLPPAGGPPRFSLALAACRPLYEAAAEDRQAQPRCDGVADESEPTEQQDAVRGHRWLWAGLISGGMVAGTTLNSLTDAPTGGYKVAHEGWFGENTYVGGADKASHFVSFEIIARELDVTFRYLGFSPTQSILGGFAVSSITGLANEVCDGANKYGFSYEDLITDVLGAGTAAVISATNTTDLFGFRFGILPGPEPARVAYGTGRDYSSEIYTADLKLAGLTRRLGRELRATRFFLVSTTYGVYGYPYGAPDQRERLIGFEVGLNVEEILYAFDVDQETWWGIVAHAVFDNFRIPYTQLGFRYDINHGNWYGPAVGGAM